MEMFGNLALILGLAAVGGILAKLLKQPALLGYVFAGAVISYFNLAQGAEAKAMIETLGQLGVTLLLFLVGLELPISELKRSGRVALATGIGQIVFTAGIGYFLIILLGFNSLTAIYLAIALAFSSTIVIVKLLSEKRDLHSLYGKIAVGFLLVQDFVAIGLLVVLSGFSQSSFTVMSLIAIVIKASLMVGMALWLSTHVFPKILGKISASTEILFISALAWCLGVAALVASPWVGFGLEIGGFVAGLALANAAAHLQIVSRVRPIRDFFLTLFFVTLGANIHLGDLSGTFLAIGILSAFVLIGNPLIVMTIMGVMGYKKRTSFLASVTVAQISEFSLIVIALAVRIGHVSEQILAMTAMIGVITMTVSTYMIVHAEAIYKRLARWLSIFERKDIVEDHNFTNKELQHHILLFGHSRTGTALRPALEKLDKPLLIVDFDPEVVDKLVVSHIPAVFGDVADTELYELINVTIADLVVSTIPDLHDNLVLLDYIKTNANRAIVIVVAQDNTDASILYSMGADFVLLPNAVGGEYLAHIFNHHGLDRKYITDHGNAHRQKLGA